MDFLSYKSKKISIESLSLESKISGTIIVAPEGINATISGTNNSLDQFHFHQLGKLP